MATSTSVWSTDEPVTWEYNDSATSASSVGPPTSAGEDGRDGYIIVFKYVAPLLIVLGTVGNVLSVVVLQSRYFRRTPSAFTLSALSLTDTGVLLCGLLRHWIFATTGMQLDVRRLGPVACPVHYFFTYYLPQLSSWTLVMLTVERMASVRWPFEAKRLFGRWRMFGMWLGTALCLAAVNCHCVKTVALRRRQVASATGVVTAQVCTYAEDSATFGKVVWPWIDLALLSAVPTVVILSCNVVIIVMLTKASRLRQDRMKSTASDDPTAITAMLVGVSALFVLATTPSSIYFIGIHYWPWNESLTAYAVVNIVYYLSNSLNFLVYCVSGTRFRRALVAVLCCGELEASTHSTASKYTMSNIRNPRTEVTSAT